MSPSGIWSVYDGARGCTVPGSRERDNIAKKRTGATHAKLENTKKHKHKFRIHTKPLSLGAFHVLCSSAFPRVPPIPLLPDHSLFFHLCPLCSEYEYRALLVSHTLCDPGKREQRRRRRARGGGHVVHVDVYLACQHKKERERDRSPCVHKVPLSIIAELLKKKVESLRDEITDERM